MSYVIDLCSVAQDFKFDQDWSDECLGPAARNKTRAFNAERSPDREGRAHSYFTSRRGEKSIYMKWQVISDKKAMARLRASPQGEQAGRFTAG